MWPWEHAALGYLAVSLTTRVIWSRPPSDRAAIAAVFGTQLPDLLDKPLGWVFDIFPSGISVGHSLVVALGLSVLVLTAGFRSNYRQESLAFCLGLLSHIPADIFYPMLFGGRPNWAVTLWPFVIRDARGETPVLLYTSMLFDRFLGGLAGSGGVISWFLLAEIVLVAGTIGVWIVDGHPGLRLP